MASYTANYGLHQWEAADNFLRTDFNTDFGIIDTALNGLEAGKAEMVRGQYVGTGTTEQTITLGFQPKFMIILSATPQVLNPQKDTLFIFGSAARFEQEDGEILIAPAESGSGMIQYAITPTDGGIMLYSDPVWNYPAFVMNTAGTTYHYFAMK